MEMAVYLLPTIQMSRDARPYDMVESIPALLSAESTHRPIFGIHVCYACMQKALTFLLVVDPY